MQIGIVGKPNVGKSTFFNAATRSTAEVANYPFTTIEANRSMAFVKVPEPAKDFSLEPKSRNSLSRGGYRFVPVEAVDVAGLVPGAHRGRGLGNRFLDELRQASVLIHIVDASGSTDDEGRPAGAGQYDPCEDVSFLEEEIEHWFFGIFRKNWEKMARRVELQGKNFFREFAQNFSGLGVREHHLRKAINEAEVSVEKPESWSDEQLFSFTKSLRKQAMPIVVAANKVDIELAEENIRRMKEKFPELRIVPVSSMAEHLLETLAGEGIVHYTPGGESFEVLREEKLSSKQRKGLEIVRERVLKRYSSTGVQDVVNASVLDELGKIVVFPVEDENRLSDKDGRVLPDAFLLGKGSTPRELAYKIHTDIGENFIASIDARTKRRIASDRELNHLDIVKIVARA